VDAFTHTSELFFYFRTLTNSGTQKTIYNEKQVFTIEPWTPHILFFLDDSVLAEWWDADEFVCYYYHPYRKIIDVQNSLIAKDNATIDPNHTTGRYQRLIPQDEASLAAAVSRNDSLVGKIGTFLMVTVAAAAGVVAGIAIGVAMGEDASSSSSSREAAASSNSK